MNTDNLRDIDLNLLVVLNVLLQEQNVTRTATRLHLTPSAISHALRRLRELFDDELFVRDGRRMRPTVRAHTLNKTVPAVLRQLEHALAAPEPFIPTTSTRTFRLAAPDFIVPLVLKKIGKSAPFVQIECHPTTPSAVQELTKNHYDALVAPSAFKHEGVRGCPLGEWPWLVFGHPNHPAFDNWSLDAWTKYPHLQIGTSILRGNGPIDQHLSKLGVSRRIGAVVPHFSMAASVVSQTELLVTVPAISMRHAAETYQLAHRTLPLDLPPLGLSLFRSAISGDEKDVRWFLDQIQSVCTAL